MSDKIQTKQVTFILRNKKSGFSIHNVFMPIITHCKASYYEAPCERASIVCILKNLRWVRSISSKTGINHMTGGPHYFLLAIPFRKNVLTIHDLVLLRNSHGIKHLLFKWLWFYGPISCARAVTCITDTVRNELLATLRVNPQKVTTIYNPVSPLFQYYEKKFNTECPRILHIGTAWNKNTTNMIYALHGICSKLVIVGDITAEIEVALKNTKADCEILCNLTNEELYEQYRLADIISFPSIFEGFGMPIIEGQATGRPVLTSNIPPMTEVAGEGACFVNPNDIEDIRKGFLRIINDDEYRSNLISKGSSNAKRFSVDNIMTQFNNLYKTLYEDSV